jgi:microcystin-dependent protein
MPTPVYQLAFGEKQQFEDVNGNPLAGAKLFVYVAGTATKITSYQETDGVSQNTNPIILDGTGALPKGVYVTTGLYKVVLAPSTDTDPPSSPIWTRDQLTPVNDTAQAVSEWQAAAGTPVWTSTTTFSLTGDRTGDAQPRRRVRVVDSGGTKYGYISASSYGAPNTSVTVVLDSGVLATPISSVDYGLLTALNSSIPILTDVQFVVADNSDNSKQFSLQLSPIATATKRIGSVPNYDIRIGNLPAGIGPLPYSGATIPVGWLECDGSAVSRTTYADLFAAISTTWGAGDGSTTFNLPDCRGRTAIGAGTGTNAESFTNTAINTGTDRITVASNNTKWLTGAQVVFTTGGTPPTTNPANLLDNNDTVFVIRISTTEIQFATSLVNAVDGVAIDITAAGSGTFTITETLTARTLGQNGGEQGHSLVVAELASHTHGDNYMTSTTGYFSGGTFQGYNIGPAGTTTTGATGGNQKANVMQPFVVAKMIISY